MKFCNILTNPPRISQHVRTVRHGLSCEIFSQDCLVSRLLYA